MSHHFDQRHLRHRVEEVQAEKTLRRGEVLAQLVQRNARGIAGEDLVGLELRLDLRVQLALRFGVLVDRLDCQIGGSHAAAVDIGTQPADRCIDLLRRLQLLLVQLACPIQRRLDVFHLAILQGYLEALERGPRGNIAAHHAGADDMHMLDAVIGAAALALQPLLQEEDADQVLRGRRLRQLRHRACFDLQSLLDAGAAALPHVDHREWGWVVLAAYLCGGLLEHHRCQDLPGQPGVAGPGVGTSCERARRRAAQQQPRFGQQFVRSHDTVDHTQTERAFGRQRLAGEHDRQRFGGADQTRQARGAAPAGMNAEHHFRQRDPGLVVIGSDTVAAGQNQFGAATHARTVHGCHRGAGQARQ